MSWGAAEWSELIQNAGIVGGLGLSVVAFALDRRARRADALFRLTDRHGVLWSELLTNAALARVLDAKADVASEPPTPLEVMHLTKLVLHLNAAFRMYRAHILKEPEGLTLDIQTFFALPVPRAAWQTIRRMQDRDFVAFLEDRMAPCQLARKSGGNSSVPS
jgi:hypothetical protein